MSFATSELLAIALKSSRCSPQHLAKNSALLNIYSRTQNCNDHKLTPMCFLMNSP